MTDPLSKAINILMGALKHLAPDVGTVPVEDWSGSQASKRHNVYRYSQRLFPPVEDAAVCLLELIPNSEGYPLATLCDPIIAILLNVKDVEAQRTIAAADLRVELEALVKILSDLGEWEVLLAVQGVNVGTQGMNVGRCSLKMLSNSDVELWERRMVSGKYDPPANTVVVKHRAVFRSIEQITNKTVACTHVKAIDTPHAKALATKSIEESLDLLRSMLVAMGNFDEDPPRLGISHGPSRDSGIYFRHDKRFASHLSAHGGSAPFAQLINSIPGQKELDRILKLPDNQRNDFERRIVVALQWMGQATLTPFKSVRFVCLATAVEAILLQESETRGITDKFTKRGAWILGDDAADRTAKAKYLDECYAIRSSCVHGRGREVTDRMLTTWAHTVYAMVFRLLTQPQFSGATTGSAMASLIDGWEAANPIIV